MTLKDDWLLWNREQASFAARETEGFTKDVKALHDHIMELQRVCPKDNAGWPVRTALSYLDRLRSDYDRFQRYLDQLR